MKRKLSRFAKKNRRRLVLKEKRRFSKLASLLPGRGREGLEWPKGRDAIH
jgi:hypothetical protein